MTPERLKTLLVEALQRSLAGGKPMVPEAGRLVWGWFCDLSNTRTYHMAGPNPISHAEIEAYARLHRWPLEARHVDLIAALDKAWLAHVTKSAGKATGPAQPINAAAFDAVFG